jgi:hypothetical protein
MYEARQAEIQKEWEDIRADLDKINVELEMAKGKKAGLAEMNKELGTFKGKARLRYKPGT